MRILVAGAGGFIGGHLVARLLDEGHEVRAADIEPYENWWQHHRCKELPSCDLRRTADAFEAVAGADQIYNLACNMGGMGFIGSHKADCMLSVLINTNLLWAAQRFGVKRTFFSSSACVYPERLLQLPGQPPIREDECYPAPDPMDGYGWEKLFSERMCRHMFEDYGLETRVARFDPIYGPHGTWDGGREKAPAAMCRKVAIAKLSGQAEIDVWGDGLQTRTFCYIDDAIDGIRRIMDSDLHEPINLGSSETVTINDLVDTVCAAAGTNITRKHIDGPQGARGRQVDNSRLRNELGWNPTISLAQGIERTYEWVEAEVIARTQAALRQAA